MGKGVCHLETITMDLTDLKDFVVDLKEDVVVTKTSESIYVKRITELQSENENLCKKLKASELDNSRLRVQKIGIAKANDSIIKRLNTDNKIWQETCNMLKEKNEKLRGPHWVEE